MVRAKTAETVKFSYLGKDYALQLKIEDVSGCSVLVSVDPQVSGGLTLSGQRGATLVPLVPLAVEQCIS